MDREPGLGGGRRDQLDDHLMGDQWRPRQLTEIALNSRCSIPFYLEVPGGKWQTVTDSPVSAANLAGSVCHDRTR